jgi:tartronate-semialdehyde synthase
MNTQVDLTWDEGPGIDHVMVMQAMGADGVRVTEADDIAGAIDWAVAESESRGVPVLVEVMVEREANAAMGKAIDAITEFEPVPDVAELTA